MTEKGSTKILDRNTLVASGAILAAGFAIDKWLQRRSSRKATTTQPDEQSRLTKTHEASKKLEAEPTYQFDGVVWDLDGVVAKTPHYEAWRDTFAEFDMPSFTPDEYANHVSGLPRYDGVAAAVTLRKEQLIAAGRLTATASDDDINTLVHTIGDAKQKHVVEQIASLPTEQLAYPDALRLIIALAAAGKKQAIASSSENTLLVLDRLGIRQYFDVIVANKTVTYRNGTQEVKQFAGKPAPDIFEIASREMGVEPQNAIGIEDAPKGIASIHAAGLPRDGSRSFGMCPIAVNRESPSVGEELAKAGAAIVVTSLDSTPLATLGEVYAAYHRLPTRRNTTGK